jgi:hypothetical protein
MIHELVYNQTPRIREAKQKGISAQELDLQFAAWLKLSISKVTLILFIIYPYLRTPRSVLN